MKQSEIWLIDLEPTVGAEIKKTRPAIIVNDDALGRLPLKIIVPLTDWKDNYAAAPWMVKILPDDVNNLSKDSSADCFQVRSLSESRFVKRLGKVEAVTMDELRAALKKVFSMS
jgi:mRNA interferase MazF